MRVEAREDKVTISKLIQLYLPLGLMIIHGLLLFNNIEIWAAVATPLIYIYIACTLMPILKAQTRNYKTVLFFFLGIFIFGTAEIIWFVLEKLLNQDPGANIFLAYYYVIPNLLFVIAISIYIKVNISKWHPIQLFLDFLAVTLEVVGLVSILFFDAQVFGNIELNAGTIPNYLFLLFDAIGLTLLVTLRLSSRNYEKKLSDLLIFLAMTIFFIADSSYVNGVINNTYVPYGLIDWLFLSALIVLTLGIKVEYYKYYKGQQGYKDFDFLNEGPSKNIWLLIAPPISIIFIHGIHFQDIYFFAIIIILYLIASLYIQRNINNERMLHERSKLNETLQEQVNERTMSLQLTNEQLTYLVQHDNLTGLYNREYFSSLVDRSIEKCNPKGQIYLIVIDINRFRMINDLYGLNMGDEVLKLLAVRINMLFNDTSYSSRIDGNEFAVICCDMKPYQIQEDIQRFIASFAEPIEISRFQISVKIKLGIATYPKDANNRIDLFKAGKAALQQAKSSKSNTCYFYDKMLHARIHRRHEIEVALERADLSRELVLLYQPQYEIKGNILHGMEALVRWKSSSLGLINPAEFISVAEETGLILKIGDIVMEMAFEQIVRWNTQNAIILKMSINVSPIQIENTNFIERVKELMKKTGVKSNWISFEITENAAMDLSETFKTALTKLQEIGIAVAIDDFGTGYSSYGYLKKYSIKTIKLDKFLIDTITESKSDAKVVQGIIAMAKAMEIKTVAEGVETRPQADLLGKLGCDIIQGYFLGKPISEEEFTELIIS